MVKTGMRGRSSVDTEGNELEVLSGLGSASRFVLSILRLWWGTFAVEVSLLANATHNWGARRSR